MFNPPSYTWYIQMADPTAAAQHSANNARRLRVKCSTPSTTSGQIT